MSTVMRTYKAKMVDLMRFSVNDVNRFDIAHSLARINRWNGHTREPISVGQHSVECSRFGATPREQMALLLHDAHEAYVGDFTRPQFDLIVAIVREVAGEAAAELFRERWKTLLKHMDKTICQALGVPYDWPDSIYDIDDRMLLTEGQQQLDLLPIEVGPKLARLEPLNCDVRGWRPDLATDRWQARFIELHQLVTR